MAMVRVETTFDDGSRSSEPCPRCGARRLTLLEFPPVAALPYLPYSELIGMGEAHVAATPGIGCLECGAEWPDLASFRDEASATGDGSVDQGELPST